MPSPDFTIRGSGESYVILQGQRIVGRANRHGAALAALPGLARRLTPKTPRPCLCCGGMIQSTGPGHRLCPQCKEAA